MTTVSGSGLAASLKEINAPAANGPAAESGLGALGQGDFLRLLLTQLQQQDPLEPVDNKDMLAQMAQFTALAGSAETNSTLSDISTKLDALIAAQKATIPAE